MDSGEEDLESGRLGLGAGRLGLGAGKLDFCLCHHPAGCPRCGRVFSLLCSVKFASNERICWLLLTNSIVPSVPWRSLGIRAAQITTPDESRQPEPVLTCNVPPDQQSKPQIPVQGVFFPSDLVSLTGAGLAVSTSVVRGGDKINLV